MLESADAGYILFRSFVPLAAAAVLLPAGARADETSPAATPEQLGAALDGAPASNEVKRDERPAPSPADAVPLASRHRQALALTVGPSWPQFSGGRQSQPMLLVSSIGWSRRFELPGAAIEPGFAASLVRVPFETTYGNRDQESLLWSAFATVRVARGIGRSFEVGATAAAGLTVWTGLGDANPFTTTGTAPDKTPVLPTLGAALDLRYFVRRRVFLLASTGLNVASISSHLLVSTPSRMTRAELLAGLGFAL